MISEVNNWKSRQLLSATAIVNLPPLERNVSMVSTPMSNDVYGLEVAHTG